LFSFDLGKCFQLVADATVQAIVKTAVNNDKVNAFFPEALSASVQRFNFS
jgi:hypothetical protein